MTIVQKILAAGLLLISTTAFAATSYTYDELNRLTKVVYDDGRSISYSYDAAGNLLRIDRAAPVADPGTQLEDPFDGTALNPALWTAKGVNTCGGVVVGGGQAKFNGGTYANTEGNKAFAGDKIVVQALMAGKQSNRDTHFELVDTVTGDRLQFGDTSYQGQGLYFAGTGRYLVAQRSLQQASTPALRAYRLTAQANQVTLERGDSFDVPMSSTTITLPNSVAGRSFYLQIGTGGSDCYYSPGTFDWIKVSADSRLQPELTDDFNTIALDTNKWISAGYEFEPGLISRPAGSFSLHDGVLELFNAGGIATISKQHFKGRKIVVEARVARTGSGEFPIMLVNLANLNDRILISETPYCGAGFVGVAAGIFKFTQMYPQCGGALGYGFSLGNPAAIGVWMEYRLTVDGDKFTMERGPTLSSITQTATASMSTAINAYEFFLYLRTGSSGGYYGAKFDWVRVTATP